VPRTRPRSMRLGIAGSWPSGPQTRCRLGQASDHPLLQRRGGEAERPRPSGDASRAICSQMRPLVSISHVAGSTAPAYPPPFTHAHCCFGPGTPASALSALSRCRRRVRVLVRNFMQFYTEHRRQAARAPVWPPRRQPQLPLRALPHHCPTRHPEPRRLCFPRPQRRQTAPQPPGTRARSSAPHATHGALRGHTKGCITCASEMMREATDTRRSATSLRRSAIVHTPVTPARRRGLTPCAECTRQQCGRVGCRAGAHP